ncbi:hypothetical protein AURDEDRAFT_161798 [Auricularia subglabra TFB-10046 SS5]|nr:hypothetical protein AURDEDRAFT_161798 [Auricularia subglabra TFB-10046 SS5]
MGRGLGREDAAAIEALLHSVLSRALAGGASSLKSKPVDFACLRQDLLSLTQGALLSAARNHNRSMPINRLPVELVHLIASSLSLQDRCVAALVCSYWRGALLNAPSLWTQVKLDLKHNTSLCTGFLVALAERSRRLPLDVQLRCRVYEPEATDDLCEVLSDLMPRVRSLDLSVPELTSKPFGDVISTQAPILEYARLACIFDRSPPLASTVETLSPGLFGGHAPALRHICLDGVQLAPIGQTLALQTVHSFTQLRLWTFDATVLRPILRACPRLRCLTALPTMRYDSDALTSAAPPECRLHTLRLSGQPCAASVVQKLCAALPELQTYVSFLATGEADEWRLRDLLVAVKCHAARITLSVAWTPTNAWKRENDTSSSVLALYINGQPVALDVTLGPFTATLKSILLADWLAQLAALAAPSDIWYTIAQCRLPRLRELELFLPIEPCWPLDAQLRTYEPLALTTLCLTAESPLVDGARCGVLFKDVLEFIRVTISLRTLNVLVLRGVTVLADEDSKLGLRASVDLRREDRPDFPWDVSPEPWCTQFPEAEALEV